MTHILSALILVALIAGRSRVVRRRRLFHSVYMSVVIAADLTLILYLVFGPRVLTKVSLSMPGLLYVHIAIALGVVGLYVASTWVGYRLYQRPGDPHLRAHMRSLDRALVPLRTAVFVTGLAMAYL